MQDRNNKRRQERYEAAKKCLSIPGDKGDGFMANVFANVVDLDESVDNENLREYIAGLKVTISLHMALRNPFVLTKSASWGCHRVGEVLQVLPEHDRMQAIAYLERQRYEYTPPDTKAKKSLFGKKPPLPQVQTYRLAWNGVDDFIVVRIA